MGDQHGNSEMLQPTLLSEAAPFILKECPAECLQLHQGTRRTLGGCLILVIWWELESGRLIEVFQFVVLNFENSLSF